MAMAAATSSLVMVVVFAATAALSILVVAFAVIMTAVTLTVEVIHQVLDFLVGGIPTFKYLALKLQRHACERVVEIHFHEVVLNLHHLAHKVIAVFVLKWDDRTLKDILMIEVTINAEYITLYVDNTLVVTVTISLILGELELESSVLVETSDLRLEGRQRNAEARNELERSLC